MPTPLAVRSPNTSPTKSKSPSKPNPVEKEDSVTSHTLSSKEQVEKSAAMDSSVRAQAYSQRQLLQEDGPKQQTYISPSDTILSPATRKISALKGKRFANAAAVAAAGAKSKSRSLFAKTSIKNANAIGHSPDGSEKAVGLLGRDIPTSAPREEGK